MRLTNRPSLTFALASALILALGIEPQALAKETDSEMPLGAIGGAVHADPFTGLASTSVPLDLPTGRNGIQPNLNLVYSSSNGNGWVGMGWKLELGSIQRNTRFGLDYSQNEYSVQMSGLSSDLMQAPPPAGSDEYQAKFEGAFYRMKKASSGGWEVTDTKGTKYLFGQTTASRAANPADESKVFKWYLDRIEDRDGNYLTVSYVTNQGQVYLDHIDYTGNGTTLPPNSVKFYLASRSDAPPLYSSNYSITTAKRLNTVEVKANNILVRAYRFNYAISQATNNSLLAQIQQFGRDALVSQVDGTIIGGTALPSIVFGYGGGSPSLSISFSGPAWSDAGGWGSSAAYYGTIQYPDLNGDGKADICGRAESGITCYLSTGSGFSTAVTGPAWSDAGGWGSSAAYYGTIQYPDLNGDGKADICGRAESGITCYLSTGSGFSTAVTGPAWNNAGGWNNDRYYATIQYPDLNGDGKADICGRAESGITCYLSTGSGFSTAVTGPAWSDAGGWGSSAAYYGTIQYPDLNGDGKADICGRAESGITCYLSSGAGFSTTVTGPAWSDAGGWGSSAAYYGTIQYPDLNGDGKADICGRAESGITCYLSTGSGFSTAVTGPAWNNTGGWNNDRYYATIQYPDLNGDGKADICGRAESGITCYLSSGTGFSTAVIGPAWSDAGGWGADPRYYGTIRFRDISGDGKMDICGRSSNGIECWKPEQDGVESLRAIANGLGGSTAIAYTPSTQYANTQLSYSVQTVSAITTCDNWNSTTSACAGTALTTAYTYSGGYHHIGDREFRGFNYFKATGPVGPSGEQLITEMWSHQGNDVVVGTNNPNVPNGYTKGLPYQVKVTDATGRVWSETTTTYVADSDGVAPFFAPVAQVDVSVDNGAKQTRTVYTQYDIYGNVLREDQYGDLSTPSDDRTIVRTVANNTIDWLIGFPTSETVYQGIGLSPQIAQTTLYYDGTTSCGTASTNQTPTMGHLTRTVRWLNGGTNPETRMAYL